MDWQQVITTTKKLKVLTVILHALIVIGMGHGVLTLGILEFFVDPFLSKAKDVSLSLYAPFEARLPIVFIFIYAGQFLMLCSILAVQASVKLWAQIISLVFLWLSIVYFSYDISNLSGHGIYFGAVTAVPFAICTIITFAGKPIRKGCAKIWNWIQS